MQQIECVLREVVETELVAVVDRLFEAGCERVVELSYLGHRRLQAHFPALGFGCQAPLLGELLEFGEGTRQTAFRHVTPPPARVRPGTPRPSRPTPCADDEPGSPDRTAGNRR